MRTIDPKLLDILVSSEQKGGPGMEYKVDENTYVEESPGFFKLSSPKRTAPVPYDGKGQEIFVVSDLHMAAGRNPAGVFRGTENFFADEPFCRFINHIQHTKKTSGAVLIFNGDIFDFLRVTEYPGKTRTIRLSRRIRYAVQQYQPLEPQAQDPGITDDEFNEWAGELAQLGIPRSPQELRDSITPKEKKYGLDTNDYKTIYKFIRIHRGHPLFFEALAGWLINGNRILVLKGNHDLEICWKAVRDFFRLILARNMSDIMKNGDPVRMLQEQVIPNLGFADDAVLIDGDFYLDHGHRYDKLTMVTGGRFLASDPQLINIPFGSFFNRYLINRVELFYPYLDKVRPSGNVIPMLVRQNFPLALKIFFQQIPFTLRILSTNRKYIWFMFNRVFWMLLVLALPVIFLLVTHRHEIFQALFVSPPAPNKSPMALQLVQKALKGVGALLVPYFLARIVAWFQLAEPNSLEKYAKQRAEGEGFRIMTFGHTHNAGTYIFPGGLRFYNTGTWIPVIEISTAEVREDRTYTFLHLERDINGKLEAADGGRLQRWNDDAGRAELQLLIERK